MKKLLLIIITSILFLHCDIKPKQSSESPSDNVAFVVTTDYSIGSYSTIGLESLNPYGDLGPGLIHSDAVARYHNNRVYIVNRLGRDNIQVLDPAENFKTIQEISTGSSSNPHDIIIINSQKAYVSLYGETYLLVLNPESGETISTIDLSLYAENSNGVPNMSQMYLHGNRLFIAIQRLNSSWAPGEYSSVIVIDTDSDSILKEIQLQWDDGSGGTVAPTNPYTRFRFVSSATWQPSTPDGNDHLFISCTGLFGFLFQLDGGIIAIDIKDLQVEQGFVLSEETIGTEITDFIITEPGVGYAVTSDEKFKSSLIKFDINRGTVLKIMHENSDNLGSLWSLAYHKSSGRLFVCDRTATNPGIRIYNTLENDLPLNNNNPISTGLPPFEIIFIE